MQRPDLSAVPAEVRAYIEALEAEIDRLSDSQGAAEGRAAPSLEPSEAPTTLNVITASAGGLIKRTPRHLYDRQRRGGMGIFDLEAPDEDPPGLVAVADEAHHLVVITDRARAFYWPVSAIADGPVRARGHSLARELDLQPGERLAAMLPAGRGAALALLSASGYVRTLPAHVVSQNMTPGTPLYRHADFGPVAAACWTSGAGDLLIATLRGLAIRFPERALPLNGGLGIRLEAGDTAMAVEAVHPPEGQAIFLLGADGRGTIRLMTGFAANKSPGGSGKIAIKTERLVGAVAVQASDDLFILSRLSKIIRFRVEEVPPKEGVVQGVHCMALRADECVAVTASATTAA